ncbi:hypothetical protein ACIPJK_03290 [Streptomyces roseus]|uniref:hypothetical protein n=1 Tax=Streptomyces roseus TaxID=66430 RepID=UPI0038203DB1
MRGDETQRAVTPSAESRERRGPRHAAPRKSLLNKIQIPVGKTMALAAMPTAVFVGMGMAPKLALADEEIPFAPGPCVTRSDAPAESASPSPSASTSPSPGSSPSASPSPGASKAPKTAPKPDAGKSADSSTASKPPAPAAPAGPAAAPSPSKTPNPLDPLGIGDKVKGIVDGITTPILGAHPSATPTPTPTPTPTKSAPTTKPEPKTDPAPDPKTAPKTDPKPDPAADAIRDAAKKAGVDVKELPEDVKGTEKTPKDETGTADGTKGADGKQPFPCPTYDAKALADAELEPGIPLLPDEPWYLDSSLLTLYGLDYHGIVEVKTAGGKTKKVLKFTADSLDIKDLYQTVGKSGNVAHLKSRPGSTSKIRGGTVTMYTESLKGNLFGLIPIEFTPNSPPPLNVPFAFFSNVKVVQAGQFGGTLTVPGLHNYVGPPEN